MIEFGKGVPKTKCGFTGISRIVSTGPAGHMGFKALDNF